LNIFNKNTSVYIVRTSNSGNHKLADSSPCLDCYNKMKKVGINMLIYSGSNGEILKQRFRDYVPKMYTYGRRFILNGFKHSSPKNILKRTVIRDIDDDSDSYTIATSDSNSTDSSSLSDSSLDSPTSSSSSLSSSKRRKKKRFNSYITRLSKYH